MSDFFLLKIFLSFLVVKFSIYINRRVFVVMSSSFGTSERLCFVILAFPGYFHLNL